MSFLLAGIGLALLVGASFILGGAWSLWSGRALELPGLGQLTPRSASDPSDRQRRAEGLRTAWLFGLGYGLASLGCAVPIFLLMVGTALTRGSLAEAALVLVSYAAGMALLLMGVGLWIIWYWVRAGLW
ncbi:hypothetical protein KTAU_08320 [Thermogemmatispora aurantia]|uniref:Cytochrome C biogenesis protein transmembrane domain-containing protein n=1 Tax=Thermogemmatispora aurantia TaxID=2045279 RepID=A0A5J4JYG1_9CHLR|nr:hypothetical protein [Thermogemmatispora aurantia]GER82194.1 hypothetical protein KTAU_08320 [Thermogemmatispora aurantia]